VPDRGIPLALEMARTHLDVISPKRVVAVVNRDFRASAPHRTSPFAAPSPAVAAHTTGSVYLLIGWSARLMPFDFYLMSGLPAELYSRQNLAWARSPDVSLYGLLQRSKLVLCPREGDGWRRRVVELVRGRRRNTRGQRAATVLVLAGRSARPLRVGRTPVRGRGRD
jgi:hypothetical protein